ncbi:MAG: 50S ribosomal protein L18 [Candidatus Pacebacteria bacterium]|nr:50S ribosomal protein L18 [Candidatus Paceibacterota bacterium]
MKSKNIKTEKRLRLKKKIRMRIAGDAMRPRLSVFRSNKFIYAQAIDDTKSVTIASVSDGTQKGTKVAGAEYVGTAIAKLLKEKGITTIVFDRGGFKYAGRVKILADAARAGGLKF